MTSETACFTIALGARHPPPRTLAFASRDCILDLFAKLIDVNPSTLQNLERATHAAQRDRKGAAHDRCVKPERHWGVARISETMSGIFTESIVEEAVRFMGSAV